MMYNGTSQLLELFSSEEDFVKHFIQSCFFFSQDSVKERNREIFESIKNQKGLPIRFSFRNEKKRKEFTCDGFRRLKKKNKKELENLLDEGKKLIFKGNGDNILVSIDSTGNKFVTDAILRLANYSINQGKKTDNHFINYTVSHIWKNTTHNPYYFTSLWNIAIIPNYLNYIMDKSQKQDAINEKIQETIKAISILLYKPEELLQNKIELPPIKKEYMELAQKAINEKWITMLDVKDKHAIQWEFLKNKDFIFTALKLIEDKKAMDDIVVTDLQDKDYCKKYLGTNYPILLKKSENKIIEGRYYKRDFFTYEDEKYYVTNDWYDKNRNSVNNTNNRKIFIDWVNDIIKK